MANKWLTAAYEYVALPGRKIKKLESENKLLQRELDTARVTTQNAIMKATDFQNKMNEALLRESQSNADHIATLKTVTNSVVLASGSRVRMFDGLGPTLPEPKFKEAPEPVSTRLRARQAVNDINKQFEPDPGFDLEKFLADRIPKSEETTQ